MSDTDNPQKVVGIKYEKGDGLPQVILKGRGEFAEKIIKKGEGIKGRPLVVENKELVDQLYKLPMNADISPGLFELVATVLAHLYKVESQYTEEK